MTLQSSKHHRSNNILPKKASESFTELKRENQEIKNRVRKSLSNNNNIAEDINRLRQHVDNSTSKLNHTASRYENLEQRLRKDSKLHLNNFAEAKELNKNINGSVSLIMKEHTDMKQELLSVMKKVDTLTSTINTLNKEVFTVDH